MSDLLRQSGSAWYGSGGGGTPGGSTTQIQYNNAGAFAGSANLTYNGTKLALLSSGLTSEIFTVSSSTALFALYISEDGSGNPFFVIGDDSGSQPFVKTSGTGTSSELKVQSKGYVLLGESSGVGNATKIEIYDPNQTVKIGYVGSGTELVVDAANQVVTLNCKIEISAGATTSFIACPNGKVQIGDPAAASNSTLLEIDDANSKVTCNKPLHASGDLVLPVTGGSTPADTPAAGSMRFDEVNNRLYIYDGATWQTH